MLPEKVVRINNTSSPVPPTPASKDAELLKTTTLNTVSPNTCDGLGLKGLGLCVFNTPSSWPLAGVVSGRMAAAGGGLSSI